MLEPMKNVIKTNKKEEERMKKNAKMMVIGLVLAMVFCYGGSVWAESDTGTTSATVHLNFRVTVAEYLEFRIGSPAGTIDEIAFSPTLADIQTSTEIGGTGGDLTGGRVTVSLLSNTSNAVTISALDLSGGGLTDGTNEISYASILTADDNGGTGSGGITPPALVDGTQTSSALPLGPNNITTSWTYTYQHSGLDPLPGTYTGQMTYTASAP